MDPELHRTAPQSEGVPLGQPSAKNSIAPSLSKTESSKKALGPPKPVDAPPIQPVTADRLNQLGCQGDGGQS